MREIFRLLRNYNEFLILSSNKIILIREDNTHICDHYICFSEYMDLDIEFAMYIQEVYVIIIVNC